MKCRHSISEFSVCCGVRKTSDKWWYFGFEMLLGVGLTTINYCKFRNFKKNLGNWL